jgi:hypothetical protein
MWITANATQRKRRKPCTDREKRGKRAEIARYLELPLSTDETGPGVMAPAPGATLK